REARGRAERWALLLQTISGAARSMPLDPEGVGAVALQAVEALGFEVSGLSVMDEETGSYRLVASRGVPPGFARERHARNTGLVGRVLQSCRTEVIEDYQDAPDAHPALREADLHTVVAAPITSDKRIEAVLVAGTR